MKHRLVSFIAILTLLTSIGAGFMPSHTSADGSPPTSFKYTSNNWSTIMAQTGGGTQTYHKTADATTAGTYNGGSAVGYNGCVAVIQTDDTAYDGDTNAQWWASCDNGVQDKTSISISGGQDKSVGSINAAQQQVYDYEICPTLQQIDQNYYSQECVSNGDPASQSALDKVVNTICSGQYASQLQQQCADYTNKTYNPANAPDASDSCESSGGGGGLNWILCDVYQYVQSVVNWMFTSVISPLLVTTPICLPSNGSCTDTIYQIWSHFRVYGDIFLVITLLVVVFGESIGGGLIDAYTAKKILPRLLAAAILINLSIYFMAIMIDFMNIVGNGIGTLITGPIPKSGNNFFTISPGSITAGAIFGTAAGAGLLAGAFAVSVTGIVLLVVGLAITGAIATLGVFFTLIIRQAIIIGLVLISPVAFALWCLPNTESWFKRWWDTFFQMLLVYPMVVVLFAVADVMSYLTANNGNGGSFANNVIAFMLLLIPLFLIPFTLRSSNRLMGAIQGAASNAGKQINAATGRRALGAAGQNMNEKLRATGNYSGLSDRNALFRGINTVAGTVANPRSLLGGRAGVRAARQAKRTTYGAETLKDNAVFQANQGDDKFLLAVANRGLAEQKLAATRDKFEEARANGDQEGMLSAQATMDAQQHGLDSAAQLGAAGRSFGVRHQALQGLAKTGFQFETGEAGYDELSDTARQLSGGDERAYSAIMNESQYNLRTAGRFDLGGINDGAGYSYEAGISKASGYTAGQAKPDVFKAGAEHFLGTDLSSDESKTSEGIQTRLRQNLADGTVSAEDVGKYHAQLLDAQSSPTVGNKQEINKQLSAIEGLARVDPDTDAELDSRIQLRDSVTQNRANMRRGIDPNDPNLREDQ
jgi:hypothetical protein